jgi:hypothetical protein
MASPIYPPEQLLESMDTNQVDMAVVFAMRSAGKYDEHNQYILDSAKKYSKRLIPFIRINPWKDSPEILRKAFDDGFRGLKLHPNDESFYPNDSQVFPFLEVVEKAKKPVIIHSHQQGTQPCLIGDLADHFPSVPIMIAHMGTDLYQDSMFVAKKCSNVYLETAQCPFLHRVAKNIVETLGEGKIVWGSDIPYHFQEIEKRKIELAGLTEREFEAITWHNIARLVGIPDGH